MTTDTPGYRAYVVALIARLEQRATDGELFARLALPGWRAELDRMGGGDAQTHHDPIDDGLDMEES